jgi:hypothetical protein
MHFLNNLATIKVAPGSSGSMSAVEFVAPKGFGPPVHVHRDVGLPPTWNQPYIPSPLRHCPDAQRHLIGDGHSRVRSVGDRNRRTDHRRRRARTVRDRPWLRRNSADTFRRWPRTSRLRGSGR